MGLKLSKAIVEQHGGELPLKSELNRGTQARIKLPTLTKKARSQSWKFSQLS